MTDTAPLEGITWASLAYDPAGPVDDYAGPDKNDRCETPRHPYGAVKPRAAWVEMLWNPTTRVVTRCWKACEDCHVLMAASAEKHR